MSALGSAMSRPWCKGISIQFSATTAPASCGGVGRMLSKMWLPSAQSQLKAEERGHGSQAFRLKPHVEFPEAGVARVQVVQHF